MNKTDRKVNNINRYMIVFPSVSKAGYAKDKLREAGYFSTVGKSPAGLFQTCGYALYLDVRDIEHVIFCLDQANVQYSGIYLAQPGAYRKIR